MKRLKLLLVLGILAVLAAAPAVFAQGTAFTYQGRLNDGGAPANGTYDLVLGVYNSATVGSLLGVSNTFPDQIISNGIFTVTMDPGPNVFSNNPVWLQISVRPGASTGAYTNLSPRQPITPAPTAIFAASAATAGAVSANVFLTNVTASGSFSGNGIGLTNVFGGGIIAGSISSNAIGNGQVVKSLNGLTDAVGLAGGNNIFLTTNGNTITVLTAPGLLSWIPTNTTAQVAAVNKGYLMTADAPVTVTLPAAPSLADIIRVSGSGSGGWKVLQNAGQAIFIKNLPGNIGVNWFARQSGASWSAIAASEDGLRLVAAASGGAIYTSVDGGSNWTARVSGLAWTSVASSVDGDTLAAVANGGQIYTSTNSGVNWFAHENSRSWVSVVCSANGKTLIAGASGNLNYVSVDQGITWTPFSVAAGGKLALSADGLKAVVVVNGGQIYTAPDSGVTWTARDSVRNWSGVASSADGVHLVATVNGGQIYTSIDSGATWAAHDSSRAWNGVTSSADGTRLVATVSGGQIYTSIDSGLTWTPRDTNRNWTGVASSADGTRLAATVNGGQIFTSDIVNPVTTTGTGSLSGGQYSAIELQYIGNNQFIPLSHEGFISGY